MHCADSIRAVDLSDLKRARLEFRSLKRKKFALFVGVDCNGDNTPIAAANKSNCENLAAALEDAGFILKCDRKIQTGMERNSASDIRQLVEDLVQLAATKGDDLKPIVLFYFSGHGEVRNHEMYLCTADPKEDVCCILHSPKLAHK